MASQLADAAQRAHAMISGAGRSFEEQRQWDYPALHVVDGLLWERVQAATPSPEDDAKRKYILQRLGILLAPGLLGYTGLTVEAYGSFVSGLYVPSGDLDITIEGEMRGTAAATTPVHLASKTMRLKLLKGMRRLLHRDRMFLTRNVEGIFTARVPIIRFTDEATGIECDMSVGGLGSTFKCRVLRALGGIDPRFPALVRIVKAWATARGVNDASRGTFNSYAIVLLVVFHLQTRSPAILPRICDLFGEPPDVDASRPLHAASRPDMNLLPAMDAEAARLVALGFGQGNKSCLTELLASFFVECGAVIDAWAQAALGTGTPQLDMFECAAPEGDPGQHMGRALGVPALVESSLPSFLERGTLRRGIRVNTWAGRWEYRPWSKAYVAGTEDPFDATDNPGRSIMGTTVDSVAAEFAEAAGAMQMLRTGEDVQASLGKLFAPMAYIPEGLFAGRNRKRRASNAVYLANFLEKAPQQLLPPMMQQAGGPVQAAMPSAVAAQASLALAAVFVPAARSHDVTAGTSALASVSDSAAAALAALLAQE